MPNGKTYIQEERAALESLYRLHGPQWAQHVGEYPALSARSRGGIDSFIRHFVVPSIIGAAVNTSVNPYGVQWPDPGTILFHDDPRAIRDHGSPQRLVGAPVMRSYGTINYGCVAGWAAT